MYCDVIKTEHKIRAMFVHNMAAPWVLYEAQTKAYDRQYELFIVNSENEVKRIIQRKLYELLEGDRYVSHYILQSK